MLPLSIRAAAAAAAALLLTGCASIVSESSYPVSVTSTPSGANYEIRNEDGLVVHSGVTPGMVTLDAGAGYFDGETYLVTYRKDGYAEQKSTLESQVDGWYWGNIIFGGLIGLFAVDPATGAMYKLPKATHAGLSEMTPIPYAAAPAALLSTPASKTKEQILDELAKDPTISYDEYQRRYKVIMNQ